MERLGYLCIQSYPTRICLGCTSACSERVYAEVRARNDGAGGEWTNWGTDDLIKRAALDFLPPGEVETIQSELRRRADSCGEAS